MHPFANSDNGAYHPLWWRDCQFGSMPYYIIGPSIRRIAAAAVTLADTRRSPLNPPRVTTGAHGEFGPATVAVCPEASNYSCIPI